MEAVEEQDSSGVEQGEGVTRGALLCGVHAQTHTQLVHVVLGRETHTHWLLPLAPAQGAAELTHSLCRSSMPFETWQAAIS